MAPAATSEKKWVEAAIAQAGGVKIQAARLLGVNKDSMKYLCGSTGSEAACEPRGIHCIARARD